jgi:hypothetical protein
MLAFEGAGSQAAASDRPRFKRGERPLWLVIKRARPPVIGGTT